MDRESDLERAVRVRRRFKRGRLDTMSRSFWETWRVGDASFLVAMYTVLSLLILEPAIWIDRWMSVVMDIHVPDWLAVTALLILPANAFILDRFLARKTTAEASLSRWVRALRFCGSAPPLLNLYTLSLWKGFLERRASASAARRSEPGLSLLRPVRHFRPGGWGSGLFRYPVLPISFAISLLPLLVWSAWLAGASELSALYPRLILTVCAGLHVLACLAWTLHQRLEIQRSGVDGWRRAVLRASPFLWLLGLPGSLLALLVSRWASPSTVSLTWSAYASRAGAKREPLWRGMERGLEGRWRRRPWFRQWLRPAGLGYSELASRATGQRLSFYRLKSFLVGFESLSLAGLLVTRAPELVRALLWVSASLSGIGLALWGVLLFARLFRSASLVSKWTRHPYGRYLFVNQALLFGGTYLAVLLPQMPLEQVGALFALGLALCAALTVLVFLFPAGATLRGPDMALWGALELALTTLGVFVTLEGEECRAMIVSALRVAALLSPIWSLGLFLAQGGWLLRPFRGRQVLDRRLPLRLRLALAAVATTAALPLGGLSIPFWIYAEHRLWPRSDRERIRQHQGAADGSTIPRGEVSEGRFRKAG